MKLTLYLGIFSSIIGLFITKTAGQIPPVEGTTLLTSQTASKGLSSGILGSFGYKPTKFGIFSIGVLTGTVATGALSLTISLLANSGDDPKSIPLIPIKPQPHI